MDADAFAAFYDQYERRVYNLCYRITGSPDDAADATQETFLKVFERLPALEGRELNLGAYVMTAARNASYDAIERRKRSVPTSELPEVSDARELPEGAALRHAHQEQIRAANETLPPRQREVLALRELQDLSYGEVAQIMGMNQNSVAQLISRARINLRDGLRQTALGSVAAASPQCDRALPLLAMHQDGVLEDPWLAEHLMECGACRVRLEAMEEAAVAYRQWLLLVPALWLREEVAAAAERTSSASHRGGRLLTAAGTTLVVVLALALLAADHAQTPTRAFAPAEAEEPVRRLVATPKPRAQKPRRSPAVDAGRSERTKPRRVEPPATEVAVEHQAAVPTAPVAAAPTTPAAKQKPAASKPRVRPRTDPPPPEPVVLAEPPPVPDEPPAPVETPTATPTPTPPCTSGRGCPPPRRVTCTTCGLVAPSPPPPAVPATP
jgi:RNA polymerase sigma factor (sigma-70 family)